MHRVCCRDLSLYYYQGYFRIPEKKPRNPKKPKKPIPAKKNAYFVKQYL